MGATPKLSAAALLLVALAAATPAARGMKVIDTKKASDSFTYVTRFCASHTAQMKYQLEFPKASEFKLLGYTDSSGAGGWGGVYGATADEAGLTCSDRVGLVDSRNVIANVSAPVATLFGETRTEGYDAARGYSVVKLEGTVVFVVPEGTRWFYFAAANCLDTCHPDKHPSGMCQGPIDLWYSLEFTNGFGMGNQFSAEQALFWEFTMGAAGVYLLVFLLTLDFRGRLLDIACLHVPGELLVLSVGMIFTSPSEILAEPLFLFVFRSSGACILHSYGYGRGILIPAADRVLYAVSSFVQACCCTSATTRCTRWTAWRRSSCAWPRTP